MLSTEPMALSLTPSLARISAVTSWPQAAPGLYSMALILRYAEKKPDAYNILWVIVFGFATLNILGLVARRFDPDRSRLNFGEILAIMVVLASVFLLGTEMLYLFKVFPIKLQPR